ncbi:MAG: biopolymer transporter ExbD [Synergistaceae bacterium]|nr:biopolymer transporter ExbD [Synergistaceae bacterium]
MRRRKSRRFADIDVTPLIDVLFMLIIFFVLTATFIQGKLDIDLPSGGVETSEIESALTLTVEKDGAIFWGGLRVTQEELPDLARGAGKREILIAGDKNAPYGRVAEVLSILRKVGITSAGLLMDDGN